MGQVVKVAEGVLVLVRIQNLEASAVVGRYEEVSSWMGQVAGCQAVQGEEVGTESFRIRDWTGYHLIGGEEDAEKSADACWSPRRPFACLSC